MTLAHDPECCGPPDSVRRTGEQDNLAVCLRVAGAIFILNHLCLGEMHLRSRPLSGGCPSRKSRWTNLLRLDAGSVDRFFPERQ